MKTTSSFFLVFSSVLVFLKEWYTSLLALRKPQNTNPLEMIEVGLLPFTISFVREEFGSLKLPFALLLGSSGPQVNKGALCKSTGEKKKKGK